MLTYTVLRLLMFAAVAGVLYLLGMRSWLLWVAAIVIAALLSFLLLPSARDNAAQQLARGGRTPRAKRARRNDDALAEEAEIDADPPPAAGHRPDHRDDRPGAPETA